ncbi:MAG TPA: hypothetical protein VII87_09210 [Solirubrobacteraceae bacterium]
MNTAAYEQRDDAWGSPEDDAPLPRRPRRQLLNRRSAALLAVVTAAAGFYAGVRIEKGQVSGSSATASSGGSALTAGLRARLAGATAGSATGSGASGGFPGAALAGGAGAAGSGASFGTITTVNGPTLYVSTASGNTIKVTLSGATKITKSVGVKRASLRPGDTVIVRGITGSRGAVTAATVTDSGSSGAPASRSAAGSGSGSGGSAVGSLFSNPGGATGSGGG